jgi:hypothetical protein
MYFFFCPGRTALSQNAFDDVLATPHPMVPLHLFDPPRPPSTTALAIRNMKRSKVGRGPRMDRTELSIPCQCSKPLRVECRCQGAISRLRGGDLGRLKFHHTLTLLGKEHRIAGGAHHELELACRYARFRCRCKSGNAMAAVECTSYGRDRGDPFSPLALPSRKEQPRLLIQAPMHRCAGHRVMVPLAMALPA